MSVMMDFEKALWRACRLELPNVARQGCFFHWAQCILRRVRRLGHQSAYRHNEGGFGRYVRRLIVLLFLSPHHIRPVFRQLMARADTPTRRDAVAYMNRAWFHSSSWSPMELSVFERDIRTNNGVEGWHHRLNNICGHGRMNMYRLIAVLHREATDVRDLRNLREGQRR
ncbi:MAG: hypothetical protein AAGK05_15030, partial [Pseudomonadota bacterium]